ncbi:hypothetical protein FA13DRAFT_97905 [Coprinellus micaceus]|uniref:Oxidation resistance protein 1 n=1 Tax=Coprinellus micaceus TaxID=71717 RepID=A0A4Y7SJ91_COPMI|nr:hypothetical protein FA13DRAFT_97905 [Coprinellus micaceus]
MGGHILVIRDDAPASERDSCFGVYIADGLSRTKAKGFYGGGDCFLFKYHGATGTMEVFHPTGRNAYYALCDQGYVAFGGGGSSYAVWVGQDLLGGSSAGSVCFGNGGPVCFGGVPKPGRKGEQGEGGEVEFEVVGLEVWGVGPT